MTRTERVLAAMQTALQRHAPALEALPDVQAVSIIVKLNARGGVHTALVRFEAADNLTGIRQSC